MWIQTLDDKAFFISKPTADMVTPEVICKVLCRIPRFGGHTKSVYSVAQHSVLVCDLVRDPELKLAALLHDAHEVYSGFGDVCRPAKYISKEVAAAIKECESGINVAIAERFGFDPKLFGRVEIREADDTALSTESRDLMGPRPLEWDFHVQPVKQVVVPLLYGGYYLFRDRLNELYKGQ